MKMKGGDLRLLPFIRNKVQQTYYDIYTAEINGGVTNVHVLLDKHKLDLDSINLECSMS